jgi:hypothetical protein
MEEEIWKTIEEFPDYQVSNQGRVKSLWGRYNISERILKLNLVGRKGEQYYAVNLYNQSGKRQTTKVHKLVALAFLPNPENLPVIDHINRNKLDNTITNLRWYSHEGNLYNSTPRKSKLQQQFIYPTSQDKYLVNIRRRTLKYSKVFDTLEEAIVQRDTLFAI